MGKASIALDEIVRHHEHIMAIKWGYHQMIHDCFYGYIYIHNHMEII